MPWMISSARARVNPLRIKKVAKEKNVKLSKINKIKNFMVGILSITNGLGLSSVTVKRRDSFFEVLLVGMGIYLGAG